MRRAVLLVVFALLALLVMAGTPVAATPTHEETTFAIDIQEDGDAVWTVSTRYVLENDSDLTAFSQVRAEHESGVAPSPNPDLFRAATKQVSAETDRTMQIRDVNRSSTVKSGENVSYGVLKLTFIWTNFAVVTEDQVSVEAAFMGGWFGNLGANQTLTIQPPADYRVLRANPSTDIVDGGLQWDGPQTFDQGEPSVVFEAFEPAAGLGYLLSPMAAGIGGAILGAALLFAWRRGYFGQTGVKTDEEAEAAGEAESTAQMPAETVPSATGAKTTGPIEEPGEESPATDVDTELLSDEERVEHLLRRNDGRMKQAKIVEETRWSNAKVSQLLSSMAEAGRIEKLRIGRENLISLPEDEETEE